MIAKYEKKQFFIDGDLDLDPMTLRSELDLDLYSYTYMLKMRSIGQAVHKLEHGNQKREYSIIMTLTLHHKRAPRSGSRSVGFACQTTRDPVMNVVGLSSLFFAAPRHIVSEVWCVRGDGCRSLALQSLPYQHPQHHHPQQQQ